MNTKCRVCCAKIGVNNGELVNLARLCGGYVECVGTKGRTRKRENSSSKVEQNILKQVVEEINNTIMTERGVN